MRRTEEAPLDAGDIPWRGKRGVNIGTKGVRIVTSALEPRFNISADFGKWELYTHPRSLLGNMQGMVITLLMGLGENALSESTIPILISSFFALSRCRCVKQLQQDEYLHKCIAAKLNLDDSHGSSPISERDPGFN